jgi:hypothetical protein
VPLISAAAAAAVVVVGYETLECAINQVVAMVDDEC